MATQGISQGSPPPEFFDKLHGRDPSIDKSTWGPGPWQSEPDRVEFEHAGFPCLIVRHESAGHLCGYVAVPPGHLWHGFDFSGWSDGKRPEPEPEAHGGITYANACHGRVCHVPKPGEPDDVWWLGFDAAHAGDLSPGDGWSTRHIGTATGWVGVNDYRTVEYMRRQCEQLAEQAKAAS